LIYGRKLANPRIELTDSVLRDFNARIRQTLRQVHMTACCSGTCPPCSASVDSCFPLQWHYSETYVEHVCSTYQV